jgi:hypothetical protein
MRQNSFLDGLTCHHALQLALTKFGSVGNALVEAEQVENM